jgi:hypothetical protein
MDSRPLVSCIMPTCDRRPFVGRAIRYFLNQEYPHRELVVVDDGEDCVADLVETDPRIRYVRILDRPTIGAKRNLACEQARGELIVHWDDDDWSAPWRLDYQIDMFSSQEVDVSGLSALLFCDPTAGRAWRYEYPAGRRPWVAGGTMLPAPVQGAVTLTRHQLRGRQQLPLAGSAQTCWSAIGLVILRSAGSPRKHLPQERSRRLVASRSMAEVASLVGPEWALDWAAESVSEMNLAARSVCVAPHASDAFGAMHPVETGVCHQVSADSQIRDVRIPGRRATAAKRNVVGEHSHSEFVVDRNDGCSAS